MSKLFNECEWEDDVPLNMTNFRFFAKSEGKKNKIAVSKPEKQPTGNEKGGKSFNDKPAGWSVLLTNPKRNADQVKKSSVNDRTLNGSSKEKSGKANGRKRKALDNDDQIKSVDGNGKKSKKSKSKAMATESLNAHGISQKKDEATHVAVTEVSQTVNSAAKDQKKLSALVGNGSGPESLKDKLIERLKGSRFRFINEQLYKATGEQAKKIFQDDPTSFEAYHEGYRRQVEQWPMNPLNRIIKSILKLPKNTIVADFGCGDAKLAASIPNQVYSLDLVSNNNGVIACDMANTPLESNFVNVVVFCLSLMGTNLTDFLLEANRVLKNGGLLKIAEVSSRFTNVNEFVSNVKKCGFKLENKDLKHKLFFFFNFTKERTILKGSTKIKQFSLKPCLYKKR